MVIACILKTFKIFYYLNQNYRLSVNQKLPTEVSLDQKWINDDIKRKYGLFYDLHDTLFIELDFAEANKPGNVIAAFSQEEGIYQQLWKCYFNSVNIISRKNTRLHVRHIPKRYWKHLTEKI